MMDRLTEQEAKEILFRAQCAGYPNRSIPETLAPLYSYIESIEADNNQLQADLKRYKEWVNDLQSGMYVNCIYCGYRYGPADKVPVSMAEVLKQHIEQCPEHPMSKLKAKNAELESALLTFMGAYIVPDDLKREALTMAFDEAVRVTQAKEGTDE